MEWLNEPRVWQEREGGLILRTDSKTDFWRLTHDGGIRDNGHFFHSTVEGDCTLTVHLDGDFAALYDQAGVMLRIDEKNWMKCGIEYFEGQHFRSVVVTREYSDWSILPQGQRNSLWLRVKRSGSTIEVAMSEDGEDYQISRQCYLPASRSIEVGYMAASPIGEGFEARFRDFTLA